MSVHEENRAGERVGALEARVTELELRLEYQAQNERELDEVVREFTGRIEGLEQQIAFLREALSAAVGGMEIEENELPE